MCMWQACVSAALAFAISIRDAKRPKLITAATRRNPVVHRFDACVDVAPKKRFRSTGAALKAGIVLSQNVNMKMAPAAAEPVAAAPAMNP